MKFALTCLIIWCCEFSFSQKTLNIHYNSIFGKHKVFQFFNNNVLHYKRNGQLLYQTNKVVNMNDTMIVFDNDSVIKLSEIKAIKIPGIKLNYIFYNSAFGFLESEIFYHYMFNTSKVVTEQGALVTAILVTGGLVASFIQDKHIRIKRNTVLKVVDANYQNLNKLN